jgi:hypothetical protein
MSCIDKKTPHTSHKDNALVLKEGLCAKGHEVLVYRGIFTYLSSTIEHSFFF